MLSLPDCGNRVADLVQIVTSSREKREQSASQHDRLELSHRGKLLSRDALDNCARIHLFLDDDFGDRIACDLRIYSLACQVLSDPTDRGSLTDKPGAGVGERVPGVVQQAGAHQAFYHRIGLGGWHFLLDQLATKLADSVRTRGEEVERAIIWRLCHN